MSRAQAPPPNKICEACGRTIEWRKKWAKVWGDVKYCSDPCRNRRVTRTDVALEEAIIELLGRRPAGTAIEPEAAARMVGGEDRWPELMEHTRNAARRLQAREQAVIVQDGQPVDPSTAKGPIQIRAWPL